MITAYVLVMLNTILSFFLYLRACYGDRFLLFFLEALRKPWLA